MIVGNIWAPLYALIFLLRCDFLRAWLFTENMNINGSLFSILQAKSDSFTLATLVTLKTLVISCEALTDPSVYSCDKHLHAFLKLEITK